MLRFHEYAARREVKKKHFDQYGKYSVFLVNGEEVRDSSSAGEEFGGSGDHIFYPKVIPDNEIWIEDDISEKERPVLIAAELYFLRHMDHGMSKDAAYDRMLAKEKDYRDSVKQSKKNPSKTDKKAHPKVYAKRYGKIDGLDVWLVNGDEVRNRYKTDFIEGGHGLVYSWVPNNEIWLELGMHQDEYPYVLLHEYVERVLMKTREMKYDEAHRIAAKVEFAMRKKGEFTKAKILAMTQKEAEKLADAEIKSHMAA